MKIRVLIELLKIFTNLIVPEWTFIAIISLLLNGLIFIILGIIGEYIGRIYDETKVRPVYIVGDKEGF